VTELKFRNINATPDDPVQSWGVEGILACIERGHLRYWRKLAVALHQDEDIREKTRIALGLIEFPTGASAVFKRLCGI
jgi:hypothetical protein